MAFDLDDKGNIKTLPLLSFEAAIWAEMAPCLRLLLAREMSGDPANVEVVQLTMSVEQASGLSNALQEMVRQVMLKHVEKYSSQ